MNGATARGLMWVAGALSLVAGVAVAVPAYQAQTHQETSAARHRQQQNAIALEVLGNRCIGYPKGTNTDKHLKKGGAIVGYTARSLHTSCIAHRGHYGFIAIQEGIPRIQDIYTQTQIDATVSHLRPTQ